MIKLIVTVRMFILKRQTQKHLKIVFDNNHAENALNLIAVSRVLFDLDIEKTYSAKL